MKLSNLRKCDACNGPVGQIFYVVRCSMAFVAPRAFQQTMGLAMILGGNLDMAEAFSPEPDAIKIAGDENSELMIELLICQDCYMGNVNLAVIGNGRRHD